MRNNVTNGEIQRIAEKLTNELIQGQVVRDTLPNTADPFVGEREAIYFSRARRYLQTDAAYDIMHNHQDLYDLKVMGV